MEYKLLEVLMQSQDKALDHWEILSKVKDYIGNEDLKYLIDDFQKRGYLDDETTDHIISPVGITRFNSLKEQNFNDTKDTRLNKLVATINLTTGITTIILGVLTLILSVMSYLDNTKINELESEIRTLKAHKVNVKQSTNDKINIIIDTLKTSHN